MDDAKETTRSTFDDNDTSSGVAFHKALFRMHDNAVETCIPAIVVEREDENGLLKVQPLVNFLKITSKGYRSVKRPEILVRALKMFHGGFAVRAPLFIGDTGYVVACDRDGTTAIRENGTVLHEDQKDGEGDNVGPTDPDSIDRPRHVYGFFIPCSWYNDEGEDWKELFGKDGGRFKDVLLVSNAKKPGEDGACYATMDRDGKCKVHAESVEVHSGNSTFSIDADSVKVERSDDAETATDDDSKEPKKSTVKVDGDGVTVSRGDMTLRVLGDEVRISGGDGKATVSIRLGSLSGNVSFRKLMVIGGMPQKNGNVVSIPYSTVNALCDDPQTAGNLEIDIKDP